MSVKTVRNCVNGRKRKISDATERVFPKASTRHHGEERIDVRFAEP